MKFLRNLVVLTVVIVLAGCARTDSCFRTDVSDSTKPWTHLKFYNNPENFHFAIVSDLWGHYRPGVFEQAVEKINLLKPEFVISVGDLVDGTDDLDELNRQWDEFDAFVHKLDMPFFYVPGNHDVPGGPMDELWHRRYGPTYYHFVYKNVLFLCANSEDIHTNYREPGTLSRKQLEYFYKAVNANPDVRWTFIFMHRPFWVLEQYGDKSSIGQLEDLLSDRPYTVFTGHQHIYGKAVFKGRNYYKLATTGGGSSLRGPKYGEFDHIVWVTMTDTEPIIANLLLDGILDDNPLDDGAKD